MLPMNLVALLSVHLLPWEGQMDGALWATEDVGVLPSSPQGCGQGCLANCWMFIPEGDLRFLLMARASCETQRCDLHRAEPLFASKNTSWLVWECKADEDMR